MAQPIESLEAFCLLISSCFTDSECISAPLRHCVESWHCGSCVPSGWPRLQRRRQCLHGADVLEAEGGCKGQEMTTNTPPQLLGQHHTGYWDSTTQLLGQHHTGYWSPKSNAADVELVPTVLLWSCSTETLRRQGLSVEAESAWFGQSVFTQASW